MNTVRFCLVAVIVAATLTTANAQKPGAKPAAKSSAPLNGVSFGASFGVPMLVSATDYFYNYADYNPAGVGLRYGVTGALRMRIGGIDKSNPNFAVIADGRYTTLFHTTQATSTSSTTGNARFGMLSFGVGLEQALGSGRAQPFFGLTMDVNAIEPGTVQVNTLDNTGHHSVTSTLAGDIWQLRFGVTPRMGVRTMINRQLWLDVTFAYQIANILNRADLTPKNHLLDANGRETLLSQASGSIGIMWTMPTAKAATPAVAKRR